MATTYSTEMNGLLNTVPPSLPSGAVYDANLRRKRATITLASQAISDIIVLGKRNIGEAFAFGIMNTDTSLGAATISIGISGSTAKYKADAVFTTTNTPTLFGKTAEADNDAATTEETIILTVATNALPSSGTLVIDMYFSAT